MYNNQRLTELMTESYSILEETIHEVLETYSNVHRGTGYNSQVTTMLYEEAREIILNHFKKNKSEYNVIFSSSYRTYQMISKIPSSDFILLTSEEIGLPLGVNAIIVKKSILSTINHSQSGGGTVKMVYSDFTIWEDVPDRFEAGTPSIINAIALAKAIQLKKDRGPNIFKIKRDNVNIQDLFYQDSLTNFYGEKLLQELRKTLIGSDLRVPTESGEKNFINFDNSASTPTFSPIWDIARIILNLSKMHFREIVSETNKIICDFLDIPENEYDLLFTSNTTEAINIVSESLKIQNLIEKMKPVIVSTIMEHNSNELPWRSISKASIIRLSVDHEGFVDLDELEELLVKHNKKGLNKDRQIKLVTISGGSNVLGSFNDIKAITEITHKYGAKILIDGAQLVPHRTFSVKDNKIDFLTFSGHKIYAPFGTGVLIARKGILKLKSVTYKKIKHSGEENVVGIGALGKALNLLKRIGMDKVENYERKLTKKVLKAQNNIPELIIYGVKDPNSLNFVNRGGIISFTLKNVPHNLVAKELAELGGIGVRNGCFCAHILVRHLLKIHPVRSISAGAGLYVIPGFTKTLLPGLVRASFGIENDINEVEHFLKTLKMISIKRQTPINKILATTYNGSGTLPHTDVQRKINKSLQFKAKKFVNLR
ncbi:MAG: putative cysteine desulfurase [Candidatus Heimdallarchaeota archaeon LC_3]|nr:MAG: putative cysteine desulfurase [Candidatus Heimdallarchaeota archaeon LC_3]